MPDITNCCITGSAETKKRTDKVYLAVIPVQRNKEIKSFPPGRKRKAAVGRRDQLHISFPDHCIHQLPVTQGEIHKICAAVQIKDRDPGFAVLIGIKHPAVGSILVSCFGDDRRGTGFFTPLKGIFD